MPSQAHQKIGVVGGGIMGRGIAQLFVQSSHTVRLHDARAGAAAEAKGSVAAVLERLSAKGAMTSATLTSCLEYLIVCDTVEDLADCTIIVEAIIEDLAAKQSLFQSLEKNRRPHHHPRQQHLIPHRRRHRGAMRKSHPRRRPAFLQPRPSDENRRNHPRHPNRAVCG